MAIYGLDELDELNTSEPAVPETAEEEPSDQQEDISTEKDAQDTETNESEEVSGNESESESDSKNEEATEDTKDTKEDLSNLSGVERYLSQFDIEGGMISFDDGSSKHFNELEPEKQQEVLENLHKSSTINVEDTYGLDEEEIGLINYLRENNTSLDETIDKLANQRAQTYIMSQQAQDFKVDELSNDAVYTSFLLKSNPEATTEQLEKDLETAKGMTNFDNIVKNLRGGFQKEQEQFTAQKKDEETQELIKEIETQRKEVVDVVSAMSDIDGLNINDGIKNDVLDTILNVDNDGDSLFMTKVFGDPKELFRAAFWYKNGSDIMKTREDYWKKEKSAAYKRGINDANTDKKTFSASDVEDKNKTTPHYRDADNISSLDELYT